MNLFIILIILLITVAITNSNTHENFSAKNNITDSNINDYIKKYLEKGIKGPLTIDGSVNITGNITSPTINNLDVKIKALQTNLNTTNTIGGGGMNQAAVANVKGSLFGF
jgi:hypothetical protein